MEKSRFDQIPTPAPEAYSVLKRVLRNVVKEKSELSQDELLDREAAGDIYKELESLDRKMISDVTDLYVEGKINNEEKLFLVSLFLTSKSIGPNLENVKNILLRKVINIAEIQSELAAINLDSEFKDFIMQIANKIHERKLL